MGLTNHGLVVRVEGRKFAGSILSGCSEDGSVVIVDLPKIFGEGVYGSLELGLIHEAGVIDGVLGGLGFASELTLLREACNPFLDLGFFHRGLGDLCDDA